MSENVPLDLIPFPDQESVLLREWLAEEASQSADFGDLASAFLGLFHLREPAAIRSPAEAVSIAERFLQNLRSPYRHHLSERGDVPRPWHHPDRASAVRELTRNLRGQGMVRLPESPEAERELEPASRFLSALLDWFGEPCHYLMNVVSTSPDGRAGFSVFRVGWCLDEGIVLVAPQKVGFLWFLETD